ncbi:MAG TPA: dihydrolipoamide acetyltransferase family protein [Clostridia bacterium]|nr:dihydrolipoamide acetyltransferase family protein [Clostridia bacterium]
MAIPVIMPRQGLSVESCIITKWHKEKGDAVEAGEPLFTYETDKATFEEESQHSGVLLDIFFEEGDDVPVLTNICVIGQAGEDPSQYSPHGEAADSLASKEHTEGEPVPIPETGPEDTESSTDVPPIIDQNDDIIRVSPRAKNLAHKAGIDITKAEPTGPEGRIIERDILALMDKKLPLAPPVTAELDTEPGYVEEGLTNIRKVIARTMHESLMTSAQLTLHSSFDATEILAFRSDLKKHGERLGLGRITLNDMILYGVSRTLLNHKHLNAHFLGDSIRIFKTVNMGVAIDTPRGLMVPTVFGADSKSLNQISQEVKQLNEACQAGTINPDILTGGSFTVTNLGTLGIESFTPVLNTPQTGILGVNNIVQRARESHGQIEYYPAMGLSLTFDHRAVDGAPAARFLKELVENLESFRLLLAK